MLIVGQRCIDGALQEKALKKWKSLKDVCGSSPVYEWIFLFGDLWGFGIRVGVLSEVGSVAGLSYGGQEFGRHLLL